MKQLNVKRALALYFIVSPLVSYAIDPLGSRVDFDDDCNNSSLSFEGVTLLLVIVIIGSIIYLFKIKYSNCQEHKSTNKPAPKDTSEWIKQRNEEYANQIDRLIKEEQEAEKERKGCIFFILLFFGGIIWCIIHTETNWLEAGKDLLVTLGGGGILVGILLLISHLKGD